MKTGREETWGEGKRERYREKRERGKQEKEK